MGALRTLALLSLLAAASAPAAAQCAMCRETASYQREKGIQALQAGIIVLGIPPVFVLGGIGLLAYKKRNTTREDVEQFDEIRSR